MVVASVLGWVAARTVFGANLLRCVGVIAVCLLTNAAAMAANNVNLQCSNLPATLRLCQDGNNCGSIGFPNNPTDVLDIMGVAPGTQLTFTITNKGNFDPTVFTAQGQGNTTFN